jgi:hypothetical protein
MSKMSDLLISIQDDLNEGKLSASEIAAKYEVPLSWVDEAFMALQYDEPTEQEIAQFDLGKEMAKA